MPPSFRRPGLAEDDDGMAEVRPTAIRPRALPFHNTRKLPVHTMISATGDEESVVSSLSAMSDLESLYLESGTKRRYVHNERDQFLLCQSLPPPTSNLLSPSREEEKEPYAYLGFHDDNDDKDNWQDIMLAVKEGKTQRQSQKSSNAQAQFPPPSPQDFYQEEIAIESKPQLEKENTKASKRSSTNKSIKTKNTPSDVNKPNNKSKTKKSANGSSKKLRKSVPTNKQDRKAVKTQKPVSEKKKEKSRKRFFFFSFKGLKSRSS